MLENCGLWVKKRMNGAGGALDGEARGRAGRGRGVWRGGGQTLLHHNFSSAAGGRWGFLSFLTLQDHKQMSRGN